SLSVLSFCLRSPSHSVGNTFLAVKHGYVSSMTWGCMSPKVIFQHDKNPKHIAKTTQGFPKRKNAKTSAALWEHLWGMLKKTKSRRQSISNYYQETQHKQRTQDFPHQALLAPIII
uniref:Uncharacterized protein n=1 Tax=Amphiprion percula TaxID=161767 RepID=A0A3P8TBY4_AMPPE